MCINSSCDVAIYAIYIGSLPTQLSGNCSAWLTVPKTLGISWVESNEGISCYVNEVTFGRHQRMGLW